MATNNVPKPKGIGEKKVDQSPIGFFTLREAAQAVGLQEQWSPAQIDSLTALLLKAVHGRKLILIDPHTQMSNPELIARDFYGWITRTAFNDWAQGEGALYWWHDPQRPCVVLGAGTAFVPFRDIAHELARAIHRSGQASMAYGADRINFEDEANRAALRETLPLKIPRSHVPQGIVVGQARDDSDVAVQDLADFAARFKIDVVVLGRGRVPVSAAIGRSSKRTTSEPVEMPHFVTSARPLKVPAELLALPGDARITYEEKIGLVSSGPQETCAADYREMIQVRIARQAAGYFTLYEAAQVLADNTPEKDITEILNSFRAAQTRDELTIRPGVGRLPSRAGERNRAYSDVVEVGDLDRWCRTNLGFGFPSAVTAQPAVPRESATKSTTYGYQRDGGIAALIQRACAEVIDPTSTDLIFGKFLEWVDTPNLNPAPMVLIRRTESDDRKPVVIYMNGGVEKEMTREKLRLRLGRIVKKQRPPVR